MHKALFERVQDAVRHLNSKGRRLVLAVMGMTAVVASTLPSPPVGAETTGPVVVHVPVTHAPYGQAIPLSLTGSCATGAACNARLYYRTTVPADVATLPGFTNEPGFTVTGMNRGLTTATGVGQDAIDWTASIPGSAATTRGVDYFFELEQNGAISRYPGTTYLNPNGSPISPTGTHFHIEVLAPPLLNHVPIVLGYSDQPINIEAQVTCSTDNCSTELSYHRTGDPGPWTTTALTRQGAGTAVGGTAVVLTFVGQIPGWSVDTRGVDYYLRASDGHTQAFSPGTPYQGYYAPRDGYHNPAGNYHVHVAEAPRPVHEPVVTAPYRQPIPITATTDCPASRTCSGTLYYRTTTTSVLDATTDSTFASTGMSASRTPGANGVDVVALAGTIPASVADTRGVDYFFSVTDGTSTAWFPGTSAADGPGVWVNGTRVYYQHIRIQEPTHFIHVPLPTTEPLKDLVIETELTCATEACSANLYYSTTPNVVGTDQMVPMQRIYLLTKTSVSRVEIFQATIPASQVTTRHVSYYMTATDGYTNTAAPGTFYWGAYAPIDGGPVVPETARFHVRVVDPPHPVHVPIPAAFTGQPIKVEARSNCATDMCTAYLHWRVTGQTWQSMSMAATAQTGVAYSNDLITYEATIAGGNVTTTGIEYRVEVYDGFVTGTTPTFPVVVNELPPVTTSTSVSIPTTPPPL